MGVCTFLCVLSMAVVTCSPIAEGTFTVMMKPNRFLTTTLVLLVCTPVADGNEVTVDLIADGLPIPGGYVVPERGDITFICTSSLGGVFWTLDLKVSGETVRFAASAGLADQVSQVTSPDTEPFANPATITIHNVTSKNNESTVECSSSFKAEINDSATILVEGSPNCPRVNTTINTTSMAVSIHKSPWRWLPEWYHVEVPSHFNGSIAIVYNSTLKSSTSFEVTSLEPDTVYNISILPCNMAGCNESCDVHSVQTDSDSSNVGDEMGSPNCPTVRTTVNATSLTVSIQKLQMMWLAEWYSVKAVSYNESIASIVHSSTLKDTTSLEMTSLQPDTVYNISVIPCNMAGCNESCDVHSVQTDSEMSTEVPTGSGGTPRVVTVQPHIFIGVAILVTMVLLLLIASIPVGCIIRRKRGKQTIPQTSNVDAVHVHNASLQLQDRDVTSATAAQYMNVGVTSSDITMEDNPAYQSIVMESAGSNYI